MSKQEQAIDEACRLAKRVYKIGGYAGTGKTTITRTIVQRLGGCLIGTYMGKAASVLNRKGLTGATTLHRMLYNYDGERFIKKEKLAGQVIVIDEAQTINTGIWRDVLSFDLPVILVGDPGQLEPVGDDPGLMRELDIVLDKIYRYDDTISKFAETVRLENRFDESLCEVLTQDAIAANLSVVDTWVVAFNRTRVAMNKWIRGKKPASIVVGDRLVCLSNNYGLGVYNGQTMTVEEVIDVGKDRTEATVKVDDGSLRVLGLWHGNIGLENTISKDKQPDRLVVCDYGWALTCHKMQGSQDRVVGYIDENERSGVRWDVARHRYTGTRKDYGIHMTKDEQTKLTLRLNEALRLEKEIKALESWLTVVKSNDTLILQAGSVKTINAHYHGDVVNKVTKTQAADMFELVQTTVLDIVNVALEKARSDYANL